MDPWGAWVRWLRSGQRFWRNQLPKGRHDSWLKSREKWKTSEFSKIRWCLLDTVLICIQPGSFKDKPRMQSVGRIQVTQNQGRHCTRETNETISCSFAFLKMWRMLDSIEMHLAVSNSSPPKYVIDFPVQSLWLQRFLQFAGYWSKGINKDGDEGYFKTSYVGRLQLVSSLWYAFHLHCLHSPMQVALPDIQMKDVYKQFGCKQDTAKVIVFVLVLNRQVSFHWQRATYKHFPFDKHATCMQYLHEQSKLRPQRRSRDSELFVCFPLHEKYFPR